MNECPQPNVRDTALIFEGGGMRASYTAAIANALLDAGINFGHVYGVSAGSSNAVNYVSRDIDRTRESFTELVRDPDFGGIRTLLAHKGYFNAHHIYQEIGRPDGLLPFDYATFSANPAQVTICACDRDTGSSVFWTKADMPSTDDLMVRVRASSTLPIVMPPATIGGHVYYDGGLAEGNGILLPKARQDGFKKFFIVRTRPKPYRKPEKPKASTLAFFWRRPAMRRQLRAWGPGYNRVCDEADVLMDQGRAYVVYAEHMGVENSTTELDALRRNYEAGWEQAQRDLPAWKSFLGV